MRKWALLWLALFLMIRPALAANVTTEDKANELWSKAKSELAKLGLVVPRDILMKFRTRDEVNVQHNGNGGLALEVNGYYQPYNPEEIWIVSGLPEQETLGVMVHEMTHAWQSTEAPQQDRKLTEGFATWVQFKALEDIGATAEANTLLHHQNPDYGEGLRFLRQLEREKGVAAVIEFARTQPRIP